jgi:hypothetical protein
VLEPVTPSDFPAALVAWMSRVQALIASSRGAAALAERRLAESVTGWQRIARTQDSAHTGAGYVAALIDLGRPPVSSLVEPARELALVTAELSALRDRKAGTKDPGARPGTGARQADTRAPRSPDTASQE